MSVIRLSYKSYKGLSVPIVVIGIECAQQWYPVEAFVDSEATYTVFTDQVAARIGLDYKAGRKIFVQVGDGGLIPTYLTDLTIQLGTERLTVPVGFSERLGVGFNLLGRTESLRNSRSALTKRTGLSHFNSIDDSSAEETTSLSMPAS